MTQATTLVPTGRKVGVIGAGVMGQTLMKGVVSAGLLARDQIWAADRSAETRAQVLAELGVAVCDDYRTELPSTDVVLVCVKPSQIVPAMATAREAGPAARTLFISIIAGVTTRAAGGHAGAAESRGFEPCRTRRASSAKA